MSVYLAPPTYRPGGPDGKGWNRLSLNAHMGAGRPRCALRPRTYAALWVSMRNTAHCEWGGDYAPCTNEGQCGDCGTFNADRLNLDAFSDQVLIRIREHGKSSDLIPGGVRSDLWLMNRPDTGWSSSARRCTWDELCRLEDGWRIGRAYRDEHSDGFWIHRVKPTVAGGER